VEDILKKQKGQSITLISIALIVFLVCSCGRREESTAEVEKLRDKKSTMDEEEDAEQTELADNEDVVEGVAERESNIWVDELQMSSKILHG